MGKYHNQSIIEEVFIKVIKDITSGGNSLDEWIKEFERLQRDAQDMVNLISVYTAPEEVKRRQQSLYYYEDMLEKLKAYHDAAEVEAEIKRGK